MKKIYSSVLGVDQGCQLIFSDFESDGDMWVGEGPRERSVDVSFSQEFRDPPQVSCSIKLLDMAAGSNTRYDLATADVTKSGFRLIFKTWGDTKIARAGASWSAIGAMSDDADWDDVTD